MHDPKHTPSPDPPSLVGREVTLIVVEADNLIMHFAGTIWIRVETELTISSGTRTWTVQRPFSDTEWWLSLLGRRVDSAGTKEPQDSLRLTFDDGAVVQFSRAAAPWECYVIGDGNYEWVF